MQAVVRSGSGSGVAVSPLPQARPAVRVVEISREFKIGCWLFGHLGEAHCRMQLSRALARWSEQHIPL